MASRKCCVLNCNATSSTHRLYNLPKDDKLRELWLSFLIPVSPLHSGLTKQQLINKRVCQKHFDRHQLDHIGDRLQHGYPCLFSAKEILHGVPLGTYGADNAVLHLFPHPVKELDRFNKWIYAIGGNVLVVDPQIVFSRCRVCHSHFDTKYCTASKRLTNNAVPTLNLSGAQNITLKSVNGNHLSDHNYCLANTDDDIEMASASVIKESLHNFDKNTPTEPINTDKEPVQLPETQESQTLEHTNKSTVSSARSNKETAASTHDILSERDYLFLETTNASATANVSQTSKDNTTSNRTKKRRRKQRANVKLPEAKEIIASVYKFLEAEYEFLEDYIGDICDLSPFDDVLKRTADACGVCEDTVSYVVHKTRDQHDHNVAGPVKRAKLREQQVHGEAQSHCGDSEKEQDEKFEDSSIIEEESNATDSVDEPEDCVERADDDSEERDECEVEAPDIDIDDNEVKTLDPLKTEPVEIQTELTDSNPFSITKEKSPDIEQDDIELTDDESRFMVRGSTRRYVRKKLRFNSTE